MEQRLGGREEGNYRDPWKNSGLHRSNSMFKVPGAHACLTCIGESWKRLAGKEVRETKPGR